jgi:hypothetical protein
VSTGYYGSIAGETADRGSTFNPVMQFCAWCETTHRENLSVPWLGGEYLYFCGDICLSEWGKAG